VISDTSFFEGNLPAITIGLRGLVYFQLDVTGSRIDLHSGVYGGAVDNPANALCAIVAALKGPDGRVKVPGFYDDVADLTELDRRAFAALPWDPRGLSRGNRRSSLLRRAGLHDPGADRRASHSRCQRDLGRLRGRGSQDDHSRSCPRQDQLSARGEPGTGADLRAHRGIHRPARVKVDPLLVPAAGRRPAEPDTDRPPGDAGSGAGDRSRPLEWCRCTSATEVPCLFAPASSRSWACPPCCSASPLRTGSFTLRTSGCGCPTSRPVSGPLRDTGTRLRASNSARDGLMGGCSCPGSVRVDSE